MLRSEGKKVGALKIVSFRPFRNDLVNEMLKGIKRIAVIDRTAGLGSRGTPLWHEVCNTIDRHNTDVIVKNYVAGLGGRDIYKLGFNFN
jgi:pyruvate ferredoxin oxidoreductase alpha subunit